METLGHVIEARTDAFRIPVLALLDHWGLASMLGEDDKHFSPSKQLSVALPIRSLTC